MTRVVSFNINGVRARPHQLQALKEIYDPDIIGLQETKVQDPDFPRDMIEELGYHVAFYGQKSHYGVALLSKQPPVSVAYGLPNDDDVAQRRLIGGTYDTGGRQLTVLNGYFPQGESRSHPVKFPHKQQFYADLLTLLNEQYSPDQDLMVVGDMNVAPVDNDIGIGPDNAKRWLRDGKCSFLPEEREWLAKLQDWGLSDTFRVRFPEVDDRFSWFDYRSRGFEREPKRGLRIDLMLATPSVQSRVKDAGIAYDIRAMEKPSDHCPIWVDLD
ncbi:exodeoxyribonuclease III [Thiosocius teredinicola]|uniref:exodeoxyribonuclease III n=1 Tax=Thiosocius teredinicola TaxID=1973002 RepID=UPI0009912321